MTDFVKEDGGIPRDTGGKVINVASNIEMEDATGTPQVSPLTVSSTALEIKIPINAISLFLKPSVEDVRYGDNSTLDGTAGEGYAVLKADEGIYLPCANGNSIYVLRNAGADVTLQFHFESLIN